jgi:hypothetical protein
VESGALKIDMTKVNYLLGATLARSLSALSAQLMNPCFEQGLTGWRTSVHVLGEYFLVVDEGPDEPIAYPFDESTNPWIAHLGQSIHVERSLTCRLRIENRGEKQQRASALQMHRVVQLGSAPVQIHDSGAWIRARSPGGLWSGNSGRSKLERIFKERVDHLIGGFVGVVIWAVGHENAIGES